MRVQVAGDRNAACRSGECGGLRCAAEQRGAPRSWRSGAEAERPVCRGASGLRRRSDRCAGQASAAAERPVVARGRRSLHPVRGFAPGAGAESAGARGRSAPGSGVCTRRGGGIGRIGAQSHHPGCKPPYRVHESRRGGALGHRCGCKPPQRVHSRSPEVPSSPRPGCTPPQRVRSRSNGGAPSPGHGAPTPAGGAVPSPPDAPRSPSPGTTAAPSHRPKHNTPNRDEPVTQPSQDCRRVVATI